MNKIPTEAQTAPTHERTVLFRLHIGRYYLNGLQGPPIGHSHTNRRPDDVI